MESLQPERRRLGVADVLSAVLSIMCIIAWFAFGHFVFSCLRMTFGGEADGLGMGFAALLIIFVSGSALGAGIALSFIAQRLPKLVRILLLFPAAAGALAGIVILVVLWAQGR